MAEVVDAIIAELIVKNEAYVRGFNEATAAHDRFLKSTTALKTTTFDLQAEGQKYKAGSAAIAQAEQQTTQVITRARKQRSDAVKAGGDVEKKVAKETADAVKVAAKAKADAEKAAAREIAAAQKQAARDQAQYYAQGPRIFEAKARQFARQAKASPIAAPGPGVTVASDLFSAGGGVKPGTGGFFGTSEPGSRATAAAQTEAMRAVRVEAEQTAVAEAQVDAAMVEQTRLQAGLLAARGEDRVLIREQISDMRTYNQLLKTGLTEEAAAVELETIRAARVKARTEQEAAANRSSTSSGLRKAVEGATIGYAPSGAAFAGVAAAGVAAAGYAAVTSGLDYAKEIRNTADAVGLTTKQVQVYEAAARQAGVSTDQFRSGIGQLNAYLGKAKEGDEQAGKTFRALGVDIRSAGSAGDVLPTLIDRLSSIKDPAQRAAVETRLFGEEGRRLDALLSGGNDKINDLAAALERTGAVLSSADIAKLDDTSKKLEQVKAELAVDIAKVVADNADAIRDLASAFAFLADHAGAAIQNYSRFRQMGFDVTTSLGGAAVGAISGTAVQTPNSLNNLAGSADSFLKTVQPGKTGDLSKLFAPKPPKGKSADTLAAEAEQRTKRFNDELARFQDQQLSAQADLTGDIQERAAIESQLSNRAAARAKADIDSQAKINIDHGANPELEQARARILKAEVDRANGLESDVREQQVSIDQAKIENDHTLTRLSIEQQLLDGTQEFARTAKDRLAIQLRLLDLEKQQEQASLEGQLSQLKPGDKRRLDIQAQIDALPAKYGERAQVAAHQNLGPLAAYADSLPRTAGEVQEAFEKAAVNGVEALNSGLDKSVAKALHLHGIAGQILSDFIDIGIKAAEAQLFGGSGGGDGLGGLFGGGGLGGLFGAVFGGGTQGNPSGVLSAALGASNTSGFGSLLGGLGDLSILPGFATGGSLTVMGNGGIDRNLLSLNGQPVARVNMGENINVVPANTKARSAAPAAVGVPVVQHFDLRGAVMTEDILNHINAKSDEAAARGAMGGAQMSADQQRRAARRSLR